MIQPTIAHKMGITFDHFTSEAQDIRQSGLIDDAMEILKKQGVVEQRDGALWLAMTDGADDKDRVLQRSDGSYTYFAADCGYLLYKIRRGFTRAIILLGADHGGYVARINYAARLLGLPNGVTCVLVQLVRLVKDGVEVRMSKRAGNVVTMDDLLAAIPVDVARFFFLLSSSDTHMNFDMGLATERSQKNPVYYVQYAHARMASILRMAAEKGMSVQQTALHNDACDPHESALLKELDAAPALIEEVAQTLAVHKLPHAAIALADTFHAFYDHCRVIDGTQPSQSAFRLALVAATQKTLAHILHLIGVSAPERM
jgi:arginyl-tRNA synthetase